MTINASRVSYFATIALLVLGSTACGPSKATVSSPPIASAGRVGPAPAAGSSESTRPASGPDPCSLLTDTEAATVLGGPAAHVAKGTSDGSNGNGVTVTERRCEYDLVTSDQLGHDLWVAVYVGADRRYFDETGTATDNSTISGVGDAAKGDSIHVYAFAKNTMIQIYGSVVPANGLQQVAKLAIAKL